MNMMSLVSGLRVAAVCVLAVDAAAGVVFKVRIDPAAAKETVSGRLVISLIADGAGLDAKEEPNNAPFWEASQPMFAADVRGVKPGDWVTVGDEAASLLGPAPGKLGPGSYKVQARLITGRERSEWRNDAGNILGPIAKVDVKQGEMATAELTLNQTTRGRDWPVDDAKAAGVELFEVRSKLLSDFRGRDVMLRAGVVLPAEYDPQRTYPAVYEVPGFGGDHFAALHVGEDRRAGEMAPAQRELNAAAFWIVLDPESPNGHTLFADSANNGPCGRALVEELIPALEARYPLAKDAGGRLLRGHSSGGWSTLWLALTYPGTFGAAWPISPDPVDLRRFECVDIYGQENMYRLDRPTFGKRWPGADLSSGKTNSWGIVVGTDKDGPVELGSYRHDDRAVMTVAQESGGEDLLGPDNTSAQQWDSWQAVWGPRNARGHPAALYDPATGAIDRSIAEKYKQFDIAELVRRDPKRLGSLLRERVRLSVGDADSFYLNEAVALLKEDLDRVYPATGAPGERGYIRVLQGYDHGSVLGSPELKRMPEEMMAELKRTGQVK